MTLVYSKISDSVDNGVTAYPAYWANNNPPNWPLRGNSQNGRYVCGMFTGSGYSPGYLVDCSTRPPTRVWKADMELGLTDLGIESIAQVLAVDDEGTVWADAQNNDGKLLWFNSSGVPAVGFTWTDNNAKSNGLTAIRIFALTTSGGTIKIVMVPSGDQPEDNSLVFVGTKGSGVLTKYDMSTWTVFQAFIDDHDDIWVAGRVFLGGAPSSIMHMQRLTNTSSPYTSPFTVDMGVNSRNPFGYFKDGHYVGAWGDGGAAAIFSVDLTAGAVLTDTSDASPYTGVPFGSSNPPTAPVTVPPNPTSFFLPSAFDATRRTMSEILPGLVGGATWNLDQWNASDKAVLGADVDTTVGNPIYLDGQQAFVGIRSYVDPASFPDNNISDGDFFLYDFGGSSSGGAGGDGTVDSSVVIRSWGYKLDGHTQIVWRLGPNKTLVFDRQSRSWSEYVSPGRNCWRAHVGQNWLGMATATFGRSIGVDVVAGDDTTGVLWILDPTTGMDDRTTSLSDPFIRVVVGGVSASGRQSIPCNAVQMDLALGAPSLVGASITLETSDDFGHTWNNQGALTIVAGNYSQVIEWRSLGAITDPGRIFRFTDSGATVRVSGADMR